MLFVLEGVDGSGKSTLAHDLARQLGDRATVLHRGPIASPPLSEYLDDLCAYDPCKEVHVICDRWHLGEQIYGPIYRGVSQVSSGMSLYLDSWLESRGGVLSVLSPPSDVVLQRIERRGEDFLKPQHFEQVYSFFAKARAPWRTLAEPRSAELLQIGARQQALACRTWTRWPTYVGSLEPEAVFVIPWPGTGRSVEMYFSERSSVFDALAVAKPSDAPAVGFIDASFPDLNELIAALGSPHRVEVPDSHLAEIDRNELAVPAGVAMWELARQAASRPA